MDTALVVDDERFFLTILSDFVSQRLGMHPLLARDGAAALSLLEKEPVDLVFLDIIMPGLDGLETLRRIKARRPNLPVIILTASAAIENAIVALREGADDFYKKPVDLDQLSICVARVLGKARVAMLAPQTASEPGTDRRRAPRVRMEEGTPAQLQLNEVYLLDVSLSGALVEHTQPVSPGDVYRLSFSLEGKEVKVLARAVREFTSHRVRRVGGERGIVYRTGMEFVGLEKGASALISAYVDRLVRRAAEESST